jgi:hypothetical protein
VGGAVVVAAAHIGGAALLAALEDQRAHLAGAGLLRLERGVDVVLRAIEHERLDRAALHPDAQLLGGEELVVGRQALISRCPALLGLGLRFRRDHASGLPGLCTIDRPSGLHQLRIIEWRNAWRLHHGARLQRGRYEFRRLRLDWQAEQVHDQQYLLAVAVAAELDLRDRPLGEADLAGQLDLAPTAGQPRGAQEPAVHHGRSASGGTRRTGHRGYLCRSGL